MSDATLAVKKLKPHFPTHIAHGALLFGIIERAIVDTADTGEDPTIRQDAVSWLRGPLWPAEMCGVDSAYVHRILTTMRII